jgi:hypothetical protein
LASVESTSTWLTTTCVTLSPTKHWEDTKRKWNLAILVQFIQLHVKENKIKIKLLACTCVCPATYQGYADNLERKIFRLRCSDNSEKIFRLQSGKKYFDYFDFNIIDCGVNCGLPRSGARCRALAQTIGNARGLDINSPLTVETRAHDL